jgi:hypothetical protein
LEYYLIPEEPGARSLEPGQVDTTGGQQDEGLFSTVGPGVEALNRVSKATVAEVTRVKKETEAVSVGSIQPGSSVRVGTKILHSKHTTVINNMQT